MRSFIPAVGGSFQEQQEWAEEQASVQKARSVAEQARNDLQGADFYMWSWRREDPAAFDAMKAWWTSPDADPELEAEMTELAVTDRSGRIDQFINLGKVMVTAELATSQRFREKLAAIGIPDLDAYSRQRFGFTEPEA